jgi:transcriptional regulator with XRE-family HTH domain
MSDGVAPDFAQITRNLLDRLNLTHAALAALVGVSENAPAGWLAGRCPRAATCARLLTLWRDPTTATRVTAIAPPIDDDVYAAIVTHHERIIAAYRQERDLLLFMLLERDGEREITDPRLAAVLAARLAEADRGVAVRLVLGRAA